MWVIAETTRNDSRLPGNGYDTPRKRRAVVIRGGCATISSLLKLNGNRLFGQEQTADA